MCANIKKGQEQTRLAAALALLLRAGRELDLELVPLQRAVRRADLRSAQPGLVIAQLSKRGVTSWSCVT